MSFFSLLAFPLFSVVASSRSRERERKVPKNMEELQCVLSSVLSSCATRHDDPAADKVSPGPRSFFLRRRRRLDVPTTTSERRPPRRATVSGSDCRRLLRLRVLHRRRTAGPPCGQKAKLSQMALVSQDADAAERHCSQARLYFVLHLRGF